RECTAMPSSSSPTGATIRSYQVGFGDCFLVTFRYPTGTRHMLVDFGTNGTPGGNNKAQLLRIAKDIAEQCKELHVVVATHRHKDHIAGFDTIGNDSPGKIIAGLARKAIVIQPWTEDPDAEKNALEATKTSVKNFAAALTAMHALADNVRQESDRLEGLVGESAHELRFAGETNLKNLAAVKNLMSMGREHLYVNAGLKIDIASALPGIKCWI